MTSRDTSKSPRQRQSHLCRLLEGAADSNSKTKWNLVLNFLQSHTLRNIDAPTPPFDSPVPPHSCPTVELEDQLLDFERNNPDMTPLKIAVKSAPAYIVAALCHLGPEATGIVDSKNRLPLHWACMRNSEEPDTNNVLQILIECNPDGLIHRDDLGRTPLHWIFWHHASTRQVSVVRFMCQNHPVQDIRSLKQPSPGTGIPKIPTPSRSKEIPPSAVIIPDAFHGALPLHYAVMNGASREVLKALIAVYPGSLACKDKHRLTPLAWYLGAGTLVEPSKTICGELIDLRADSWWKQKLSTSVIQMLLSSKVSRTVDSKGRTPLHWACHFYGRCAVESPKSSFLSIQVFRMLLDNNIAALAVQDREGQTPLHVLFDCVYHAKAKEFHLQEANRKIHVSVDMKKGGPVAFTPPLELIELLARSGNDESMQSACKVEDNAGCLPIHGALRATTSSDVIQLLIRTNPTSLIHKTEDVAQTPLGQAFSSPFSAPLQLPEMFELMMAAYATRNGAYMDGRLALKIEDAIGNYPIHYAVRNNAPLEVIRLFVDTFPRVALFQNAEGDLPIHCMLSKENLFKPPKTGMAKGASLAMLSSIPSNKEGSRQKEVEQIQVEKMRILLKPLVRLEHLKIASLAHGMTPLHIAVGFNVLDYNEIYQVLHVYPEAASLQTKGNGLEMYCLDLHNSRRNNCSDADKWSYVQELIFSFNPLLRNHRRKEDLLESCVKLIRAEISGEGSYHLEQTHCRKATPLVDVNISDTLSAIESPDIDCAHHTTSSISKRKRSTEQASTGGGFLKNLSISGSLSFGKPEKKKEKVVSSIYDDDLAGGYAISPQCSVYEDDESFLSPRAGPGIIPDGGEGFGAVSSRKGIDSKDDQAPPVLLSHQESAQADDSEPPLLSEVAMRLWSFFVLFRDERNPDDNYASQVEAILVDIDFDLVEKMISIPVPEYASDYLGGTAVKKGVTLHDLASPCCMAFFHSVYYFLGRYEFGADVDRSLIHQTSDGQIIWIKAIEHHATTAEYQPSKEFAPGTVEETIWETGEMLQEEEGYLAPKFSDTKADVCLVLSKIKSSYKNEVECREEIARASNEDFVIPLVARYNAFGDSKADRRYQADTRDSRFEVLDLSDSDSIRLSDYPYAVVYPFHQDGSLFNHFFHHGIGGMEELVEVTSQVAKALKSTHESGIVVNNISMRNISRMTVSKSCLAPKRIWAISSLSCACKVDAAVSFMGAISHDGSAQFQSGLMPPEMFVKLTTAEARIYRNYWETVERLHNVSVDRNVVEPYIENGNTYVLRCHYIPKGGDDFISTLPELPYHLEPNKESTDLWCFGLLLFTLSSEGHPLFHQNIRTGNLQSFERIVNWNTMAAKASVYEHVKDPLAQDLLLMLLSSHDERRGLNMEKVLGHPFFNRTEGPVQEKLIVQRLGESAAFCRRRQTEATEKSEDEWLKRRTMTVTSWHFGILKKMHFSCSGTVGNIVGKAANSMGIPCSFIMLPYLLSSKNKEARLAPTTKVDVERAERTGTHILGLSKACYFAVLAQDVIQRTHGEHWTATKLIESMSTLPSGDDFDDLKTQLVKIAASNVEAFRKNPVSILHMLASNYVRAVTAVFRQSGKAFFYLVDEYTGTPMTSAASAPYPLEITQKNLDSLLLVVLPFMHASILSARGIAGGVSGLVRLIFEAAYPHIPASWAQSSTGLPRTVYQEQVSKEVTFLKATLAFMSSSRPSRITDDLAIVRKMCLKIDTRGIFADMQRVEFSGASLWTSKEGAAEIQELCKSHNLKEALNSQAALENKIKTQQLRIRKLEEQVERVSFEKTLSLNVPDKEQNQNMSNQVPLSIRW